MVGEKVHVFLNGELVVRDTTLENYWEREKPIYPTGQIELQNHGGPLWFKNIYIREIPQAPEKKKKNNNKPFRRKTIEKETNGLKGRKKNCM